MHTLQHRLRFATHWLRDHKYQIVGMFCVFAIVLFVQGVFAQDGGEKTDVSIAESVGITLAQILAWISQQVVKVVVAVIEVLIIPILRYDKFTTSQIVGLGWAIVRDVVNMFFIIILLIIAFQTIFGVGRADWKKQIPRLLLMAVVINFSRTIAGLIIDFGQVFMITFVNAIKDIAGGNFISMFGLDKMYTFSEDAAMRGIEKENGYGVWDLLGAAFLSLVISFIVLGTVLTMAMLFAFRIVMLWILIILSPLAFFLGGAKGVIGPAEGYYSDWWKRFTSTVSIGPIMTFFLWLALATAGAGGLAETQGFETDLGTAGESESVGIITKIFDLPHFTGLIISLALIFAGIEISQQTASSIGGSAGKFMTSGIAGIPGLSRQIARIGIGVPAGAGLAVGRAGARAYGMAPFLKARAGVGSFMGKVGAGVAKVPGLGIAGRAVRDLGLSQVSAVEAKKEESRAEALKGLTGLGTEELKGLAGTKINKLTPYGEKNRIQAAQLKLVMDEKKRVALKPEELTDLTGKIRDSGMVGDFDDATKDKFSRAVDAAPSLAAVYAKERKPGETEKQYEGRQQTEIDNRVRTILASPGKMRAWGEDEKALSDPRVRKSLRNEKTREGLTGEEYILAGKAGQKTSDLWNENEKADIKKRQTDMQSAHKSVVTAQQQEAKIRTRVEGGEAGLGLDHEQAQQRLAEATDRLTESISKLSANDLKSNIVAPEMLGNKEFFSKFTDPSVNKGFTTLATTNPALTSAVNERLDKRDDLARKSIKTFVDNNLVDEEGRTFEQPTTKHEDGKETSTEYGLQKQAMEKQVARQIAETMKTRLVMGSAIPRAINFDSTAGRFTDETAEAGFKSMISENPEMILKIDGADAAGAIGKAVAQAISDTKITGIADKIRRAPSQSSEQINLINTLDKVTLALKNNYQALKDDASMIRKIAAAEHAKKRFGR